MSTITDNPADNYDSPEAFIYDQFADRREIVEKVADLELGELSDDADRILDILDQVEGSGR